MPATLFALLVVCQGPTVEVESLPFDPAAWKGTNRAEVRIDDGGKVTTYSGVPLKAVLDAKMKDTTSMAALRSLADAALLVRASDDYQVAVSAVAVAMDPGGRRYLLALERDGKPLGEEEGP